jgi:prepilin-type N-terminal cleavage/methylation domain-containing protein
MVLTPKYSQSGVTLIELIVVVAIFALVASVLLFNFSDFSTNVSIRNLSQEIALSIRKAQTYATSVQSIDAANTSTTTYPAYGITFSVGGKIEGPQLVEADVASGPQAIRPEAELSAEPVIKRNIQAFTVSPSSPNQKQFILFADVPRTGDTAGNRLYEDGGSCGAIGQGNECVESFTIKSADRIVALCTDLTDCSAKQVNIIFRRPAPDADICVVEGGNCRSDKASYVKIVLESAKGLQRTVSVWNTGQISVQ